MPAQPIDPTEISSHYGRGGLLARLNAALAADGIDPNRPTIEALAPYDQFHGRGLEATIEAAGLMPVRAADHLVDVGCGIGGPARVIAQRFGCRVTGIDLTPEFCDVARHITRVVGLDDRVRFETGDATAMPFADGAFDGAYSMNVSMNIADKPALYREIHRVLKPGGWLLLSEVATGDGRALDYPTPWAATERTSFLSTPDETQAGLREAGFDILQLRDATEAARVFGARSRAIVESGGRPPHRAVMLIQGDAAKDAMANAARALQDGRTIPIAILARRR